MKKAISLALVLVLALSMLTACGGKDNGGGQATTPPANSTTPPASQGGNDTTPSNGGLFDISDDNITVLKSFEEVQDDERETALAAIPAEMKKGVGELRSGLSTISIDMSGYSGAFMFYVSGKSEYTTLTDYYKSIGGTITDEWDRNTSAETSFDFDWGSLSCRFIANDKNELNVSYTIR
jgi:predicted small lipoprotein YifL